MKETWRLGKSAYAIVTDCNDGFVEGTGNAAHKEHYGGNLVAESICRKKDLHLIKAAPDLLEACQLMIEAFNDAPSNMLITQQIARVKTIMQEAIQRATNEG